MDGGWLVGCSLSLGCLVVDRLGNSVEFADVVTQGTRRVSEK